MSPYRSAAAAPRPLNDPFARVVSGDPDNVPPPHGGMAHPPVVRIDCRWDAPDSVAVAIARSLQLFEFHRGGGAPCPSWHTCRVVC